MTAALSTLTILAIAVWFYQTAVRVNRPPVAWILAGTVAYYGGFLFWMHGLLRPLLGSSFQAHGYWLGLAMDTTAILFGAAAAIALRAYVLVRPSR